MKFADMTLFDGDARDELLDHRGELLAFFSSKAWAALKNVIEREAELDKYLALKDVGADFTAEQRECHRARYQATLRFFALLDARVGRLVEGEAVASGVDKTKTDV